MQKRFLSQAAIIILTFSLFACAKKKPDPHLLSNTPEFQMMEKQDHKFCASLKLEFDKRDNVKSELYWRCRLSLTKYRLYLDEKSPMTANHNEKIKDLMAQISLKVAATPEVVLLRENKKMDDRQHKQCLAMGFQIYTEDQVKIDDYFACRKALIEDHKLVPPFGNTDYLKYSNDSYNIGFVIDRRIDEEIKKYNAVKEKYPTCVKYNLYGTDFKSCKTAQDKSRQCIDGITRKKLIKEGEDKISCQKKSYIQFPDEFLKESERGQKDINKMRVDSDYYNKRSFAAIGITDPSQFDSDAERVEKEKKSKKKTEKEINSKDGLYSKFEITKLRQNFIFSCLKEADIGIDKYAADLKNGCEALVDFKEVGKD